MFYHKCILQLLHVHHACPHFRCRQACAGKQHGSGGGNLLAAKRVLYDPEGWISLGIVAHKKDSVVDLFIAAAIEDTPSIIRFQLIAKCNPYDCRLGLQRLQQAHEGSSTQQWCLCEVSLGYPSTC